MGAEGMCALAHVFPQLPLLSTLKLSRTLPAGWYGGWCNGRSNIPCWMADAGGAAGWCGGSSQQLGGERNACTRGGAAAAGAAKHADARMYDIRVVSGSSDGTIAEGRRETWDGMVRTDNHIGAHEARALAAVLPQVAQLRTLDLRGMWTQGGCRKGQRELRMCLC